MQMSYGLYWRLLVDLDYLKESVENTFLVVSFTRKKRHFQMRYGLYWRLSVDLDYLKESVEKTFLVASFTRKKHDFQSSVK